jgi:hypothetical protein
MDARPHVVPGYQTVLGLSIALEAMLETSRQAGLTKKFMTRAGWLGARNEAERADIRKRAEDLYSGLGLPTRQ